MSVKTLLLHLSLTLYSFMSVQAQVAIEPILKYEGTVEYQKTQQHATILDFKYPEKDLENALEEYIKKQGVFLC